MSPPRWRALAIRTATDMPETPETQAARWCATLALGREGDRARFEAWRDSDPENAQAFGRLEAAEGRALSLKDTPEMLGLRHETLARASLGRHRHKIERRRLVATLAAAVGAVTLVPAAIWAVRTDGGPEIVAEPPAAYATAVGQRMVLTLQDGSRVTLNTASRLRVDYSSDERRLHLDAGQALFEVAHDTDRPFNVQAGATTVTAHGTRFDVRRKSAATEVLLTEGSVSVVARDGDADAARVMLSPRDLLTADASGVRVHQVANADARESWREGVVVFDDQPLSEVVREINRYTTRPLVLEGRLVGTIRISGVYRIGEEAVFAEALERGFDLRADRGRADRITLSARS